MEKLKQKRTSLRALTTKLISKVDNIILDESPTTEDLEDLFEEIMLKEKQLGEVDAEIQAEIVDAKEIDNEIVKSDEYATNLIKSKGKIKRALKMSTTPVSAEEVSNSDNGSRKTRSTVSRLTDNPYIKLPVLNIEKFGGEYADYQRFSDQFESAIHSNSDLSNIEKFNYLRSYLIGSAANCIKGYSLTNDNYLAALQSLRERYGNKSLIINSHFNKLMNLSAVKKSSDIHALRNLYDTCQTEIRNLIALDVSDEKYGTLMCQILVKILPSDIVLEITRKTGADENDWNVLKFLEILKTEINCREQMTQLTSNNEQINQYTTQIPSQKKSYDKNKIMQASAQELINQTAERKNNCFYCSKIHNLSTCDDFSKLSLDKKYQFLKRKALCHACFLPGHKRFQCKRLIKCTKCQRNHFSILCNQTRCDEKQKPVVNDYTLSCNNADRKVQLQTIVLILRDGGGKEIKIRGIYDTASSYSYLSTRLIKKMNFPCIREEKICHSLFGGKRQTQKHKCYRIHVSSVDRDYFCNFEVFDKDIICSEIPKIEYGPWIKRAKKLGIYFSDFNYKNNNYEGENRIDLLIGGDLYGKLLTGNLKYVSKDLVAIQSNLGWVLTGKLPEFNKENKTLLFNVSLHVKSEKIRDFFELDILGIKDPIEKKKTEDLNQESLDFFNATVKREPDGRYEVMLPWVNDHPMIPSNRSIAEKRLKTNILKLKGSGNLNAYQTVLKEWEKEGVIQEITHTDNGDSGHYLPHRPVYREHSSTPLRVVFDASARTKHSFSLNDCLVKGVNLIELIPSILLRFRIGKIGVTSDIRKAFLQIKLNPRDRNFLKFMWWEDGDSNKLKIYQHCTVVFGLNSSPFLLGATIANLLNQIEGPNKSIADKLKKSFYVDNCVSSVGSKKELDEFIRVSREILSSAQFDLRDWKYGPTVEGGINLEENKNVPVLGLNWNLETDMLSLNNTKEREESNQSISKRIILSTVSQIFDPIGFTCPVTLLPKLLLQDTWKLKIGWDSKLPEEIITKFSKWRRDLKLLREVQIPRILSPHNLKGKGTSIHTFCDASKLAYATCIFLRTESEDGVSCQLIQAKTRISPLKGSTIPRLELLACLIGARLAKTIVSESQLENVEIYFWSDSTNALHWIKREGNWATFILNRVSEIRKLTLPEHWHYVPGNLNIADLPSRGCTIKHLKESQWWEGPVWLKNPPELWPKFNEKPDLDIINSETRKTVISALNIQEESFDLYENTSSYNKMLKITAWIYRFYKNLKLGKNSRNLTSYLNVGEIDFAETVILKYVQKKSLSNDPKKQYAPLQTFIDNNGLIRIKTRISRREDLENFKYPVLLPSDHNITKCIIFDTHMRKNHAGTQTLMSILRERFWIIKCRKTIRKEIQKCVTCKRYASKAIEVISPPLPEERVKNAAIFEITGVDLCGPLYLKSGDKAWVVLFTCAIYRAIHTELTLSLSTDSFLLCLRRFIARRGRPRIIICDNAKNFIGASKALNAINWEKVVNHANLERIIWKFIPPSAPWWGGFYERMIGLLKNSLRKVLGRACLRYEELYTVLCDTESVINSRPLTYISEDTNDLTPLTPEMFLKEIKESGVPDIDKIENIKFDKRYQHRQKVREDLKNRFRSEYLGQIKHFSKIKKESTLKEGDVVLLGDDANKKRQNWPLGRIEKVFPSKDGKVRVATVKTQNGVYLRPVQKLYPLEIQDATTGATSDSVSTNKDVNATVHNEDNKDTVHTNDEDESKAVILRSRYGRRIKPPDRLVLTRD